MPPEAAVEQKVGDYYASFIDKTPSRPRASRPWPAKSPTISAIANKAVAVGLSRRTLNTEVDGLTANSDHVFGLWVNQGLTDSKHNVSSPAAGRTGNARSRQLPRSVAEDGRVARAVSGAHRGHPETGRRCDAETQGGACLVARDPRSRAPTLPTPMPRTSSSRTIRGSAPTFASRLPAWIGTLTFKRPELAGQSDFIVWQPTAVTGTSALVASEDIDVWKDYLRFHLIEHYASVLPKAVAAEDFAFYGTILSVRSSARPQKAAIAATNGALGQAVGQLYTQRYFPPEAKAKAQAMVADLITAYRARISNLTWMSPETKEKALAKLAALHGRRRLSRQMDRLLDARGRARRRLRQHAPRRSLQSFAQSRQAETARRSGRMADRPQIVGAVIMFTPNSEFFSAGILQPPYFDPNGDTASNYGSAGAGMAHEISHSFDELGNIYDAQGRLGKWWTAEDRARYDAAACEDGRAIRRLLPVS